jgi:hypothetical protein
MSRFSLVLAVAIAQLLLSGPQADAAGPLGADLMKTDLERELHSRACGLFYPESLPEGSPYVPGRAVCGTPVVMSIASNWNRLGKSAKEAFAVLFQRPSRQRTIISSGGHFKIHYDVIGANAVDQTDSIDVNGVPDYVDEVDRTFESVWSRQIDALGYSEPVNDGDGYFDVFIGNLATRSVYGLTWPMDLGDPTSAAYMEVENDYAESIYQTSGLDGLHVTVGHEFHHAIQFAYFASDLMWWHEATATAMEEVMYPEVDDYVQYVDSVLNFPTASLDHWPSFSDEHAYGASIFPLYLSTAYGASAVRGTWELLGNRRPGEYRLEDIDAGLPTGGFAEVLPGYVVWNYFTGSRFRAGYYPEGHLYTTADTETVSILQNGTVTGSGLIDHLAAEYIVVPTAALSGGLRAAFTMESGGDGLLAALLVGDSRVEAVESPDGVMEIPNVSSHERVVFIPIIRALEGSDYTYSYSISSQTISGSGTGLDPLTIGTVNVAAADFDGDGRVAFNDFLSFAQVYGSREGDGIYQAVYDLNTDGAINFSDFLSFAQVYGQTVS